MTWSGLVVSPIMSATCKFVAGVSDLRPAQTTNPISKITLERLFYLNFHDLFLIFL